MREVAFKQTGTVKLWCFQPISPLSRNTNIPTTQARCQDNNCGRDDMWWLVSHLCYIYVMKRCRVALGLATLICRSSQSFGPDWNISTTIGCIAVTFHTVIRGPQRMNPHDFGEPLTFLLAPTASQSSHLSTETSSFCIDIHDSHMMYPNGFL